MERIESKNAAPGNWYVTPAVLAAEGVTAWRELSRSQGTSAELSERGGAGSASGAPVTVASAVVGTALASGDHADRGRGETSAGGRRRLLGMEPKAKGRVVAINERSSTGDGRSAGWPRELLLISSISSTQ
jgi:hypothetical protein